jgi:hypothetical protein
MQLLFVIGSISERRTPSSIFNFDGTEGYVQCKLIERFPVMKTGYTLAVWMKVNYFTSQETALFSWQDQTNNGIMSVFFKTLR